MECPARRVHLFTTNAFSISRALYQWPHKSQRFALETCDVLIPIASPPFAASKLLPTLSSPAICHPIPGTSHFEPPTFEVSGRSCRILATALALKDPSLSGVPGSPLTPHCHAFTGEYSARHRPDSNDPHSCPCGEPLQTVRHVILDCTLHCAAGLAHLSSFSQSHIHSSVFGSKAGSAALGKFIQGSQ
ncbi:hypothetical protein BJV78DRAFT_1359844, partial [Lactifluus subvellereus]